MKSDITPIATVDDLASGSPLVETVVGDQYKSPKSIFRIAPGQPEIAISPLTPYHRQQEVEHSKRNRWVTVLMACLAFMILIASVISIMHVILRTNSGHTVTNVTSQISIMTNATEQTVISTATLNLTATAMAAQAARATVKSQETATVTAGLTVTAEVKASATAGVILTATSVTPVYLDTLNNAKSANTMEANWTKIVNVFLDKMDIM